MGCTAGCLNIFLNDEKHIDLFAETFMEVINDELYEPFEENDEVAEFFDTEGDILFSFEAEPIFSFGHGYENVIDFLKSFIQKAPDVELSGDFYSDWDNCCDICCLQFEYKDNKLSIMRLFSEVFGLECEECGANVEMSDVEVFFDKEDSSIYCPECGAGFTKADDDESYSVFFDVLTLVDGKWDIPEDFEEITEGDEYLTGVAPDEVTNAWKYEDELAEKGLLPELLIGLPSWSGLPRVHVAAEAGDEKAIEILAKLEALESKHSESDADSSEEAEEDECDCCCGEDCDEEEGEAEEEFVEEEALEESCESEDAEEITEIPEEADVEEVEVVEAEVEEAEVEEAEVEEADVEEPVVEEAAEHQEIAAPTECKKKKSKWWIILLVLAAFAAGAAAVQFSGLYDFTELINMF